MEREKTSGSFVAPAASPPMKKAGRPHAPQVGADNPSWVWRVGGALIALVSGVAVAAANIREKFYDEVKKKPAYDELRKNISDEYNDLVIAMRGSPIADKSSQEKFSHYHTQRSLIDKKYTASVANGLKEDFGIARSAFNPKGIWQRFQLMGINNKTNAVMRGLFVMFVGYLGVGVLRENNRLWNRLDTARQANAQERADIRDLQAQLANHEDQIAENTANVQRLKSDNGTQESLADNAMDTHVRPPIHSNDPADNASHRPHHRVALEGMEHARGMANDNHTTVARSHSA